MSNTNIVLVAVSSLVLGAGAVVVWNANSREDGNTSTGNATSPDTRGVRKTTERGSSSAKWRSLTDDRLPRMSRVELARQIDQGMEAVDVDFLLAALHRNPEKNAEESWWLVMNEIMEQMRKKGVAPERLGRELLSLVEDPRQSEVVRDYAVQHLALWVAPPSHDTPGEPSDEVRQQALEAIADTIVDPSIAHTSIPGTSLMALTAVDEFLSEETMAPVWRQLNPALTSMLQGEVGVPLSTKTTVVQSLALRGSQQHLPLIRDMARDEKINPSMRLSSIAALGIYQSEEDKSYLTSLAQGDSIYRHAAKSALEKYTAKQNKFTR